MSFSANVIFRGWNICKASLYINTVKQICVIVNYIFVLVHNRNK